MYYILELIKPGTTLVHEIEKQGELNDLIRHLIDSFYEANLALNLFNQELLKISSVKIDDFKKEREIELLAREEMGNLFNNLEYEDKQFQEKIYIKKFLWRTGIHPKDIQRKKIFMYAKSFLYAIDNFSKFLNVISHEQYNPPECITTAINLLLEIFPSLRGIRNSAHHYEDITRKLGKSKGKLKPFQPAPIDNGMIKSEGETLVLNNLIGNKYGTTMGDGIFAEIEISIERLSEVKNLLQDVLECYLWEGQKSHLPN